MSDCTIQDAIKAAGRPQPGEKLAAMWWRVARALRTSEARVRHLWYGEVEPTFAEWQALQREAELDHEAAALARALSDLEARPALDAVGGHEARQLLLVLGRAALALAERLK